MGTIETYLLSRPWLPTLLWVVLYTSDYYLTIWGSKLYRRQKFIEMEGSYELTAEFQDDINKQKLVSGNLLMWLTAGAVILLVTGYLIGGPLYLYGVLVGFLVFVELGVHTRHFRNIVQFWRLGTSNPGASGHIKMARDGTYQLSSVQSAGWAVLTLAAFALTNSPILLGGGLRFGLLACQHLLLSRRRANSTAATEEET